MEKLLIDQKKEIINKIVKKMAKQRPDLYYTDTSTIANRVVEYIQSKELRRDEYDLVKNMDFRDVSILMSFNSDQV